MNKQLAKIDRETVEAKVKNGEAINLREAAVYYGIGYSTVRLWPSQGLPMLGGKFFDSDFKLWRRQQAGLVQSPAMASGRRKISSHGH